MKAVKDQDRHVRGKVVWALGRLGPAAKKAVPVLRDCLKDKDEAVRGEAEKALRRIEREY